MKRLATELPCRSAGSNSVIPNARPDVRAIGRLHWLELQNPAAIARYEQTLYTDFLPVLVRNPLVRNLWHWDDARGQLRTRVPYTSQRVALLSHPETGDIQFATGVNMQVERYWQSGTYGFPRPKPAAGVCEFLIMARGGKPSLHGVSIYSRYAEDFLFPELLASGFHTAFSTTADHLLRLYRWCGAESVDERMVNSHRRTLMRWRLDKKVRRASH